jgi:hypothetical protein
MNEPGASAAAVSDAASCASSSLPFPTSGRPFATCLCSDDQRCRACPLVHRCATCAAQPGQRCGRPSGHRGGFVATYEDRVLRSDVDALREQPAEVEALLRALATAPPAVARSWRRNLDNLIAQPQLWRGQVPAALLDRLRALAHVAAVRHEPVDQPSLFNAAH